MNKPTTFMDVINTPSPKPEAQPKVFDEPADPAAVWHAAISGKAPPPSFGDNTKTKAQWDAVVAATAKSSGVKVL